MKSAVDGSPPDIEQKVNRRDLLPQMLVVLFFLISAGIFAFLIQTSAPLWQIISAGGLMFGSGLAARRAFRSALAPIQASTQAPFNPTRMALLGTLAISVGVFIGLVLLDTLTGTATIRFKEDVSGGLDWLFRQFMITAFIAVPFFILIRAKLKRELRSRNNR